MRQMGQNRCHSPARDVHGFDHDLAGTGIGSGSGVKHEQFRWDRDSSGKLGADSSLLCREKRLRGRRQCRRWLGVRFFWRELQNRRVRLD